MYIKSDWWMVGQVSPFIGCELSDHCSKEGHCRSSADLKLLNPAESHSPMGITCSLFFKRPQCWTNPTDSKEFRDSEGRITRRCRRCRSYICRYPMPGCVWYRFSLVAWGALMNFNVFVKPRHSKYLIYMAQMLHAQDKVPIFTVALNITQM